MWGIDYTDIIGAFSGAEEPDFATDGRCGREVIEREIALQLQRLQLKMPRNLRRALRWVRGARVLVDPDTGVFQPPLTPANPEMVWAFAPSQLSLPNSVRTYGTTMGCGVLCEEPQWADLPRLEVIVDIDPTTQERVYRLAGDPPYPAWVALVYEISTEQAFTSLGSILRDMVACSLGRRLYATTQEQEWTLVTYYCDAAKAAIEALYNGWLPVEISELDLVYRPGLINTHRLERNS